MDTSASAQQAQHQTSEAQSRSQRHRRRGRGRGGGDSASLSMRPASIAPSLQAVAATSSIEDPTPHHRDSTQSLERGRGRSRGAGSNESRTVNGRQFGGQLTQRVKNESMDSTAVPQLQADAPVFVPGQQHDRQTTYNHSKAPAQQPRQQKRRFSKSQAPDIATRTHEDIDHGQYECPICTNEIRRNSKVWSCHTCWTVFHLSCITKWSVNQGSVASHQHGQDAEAPLPRQWRCPGCNLPKDERPKLYTCWCEKEVDPRSVTGLPPHSCGNTCGQERARKCPHPCQLTCHAGPCPPCAHMGPTQICFCGKHEVTKRCSDTDYVTGWSCGEVCGEVMPCGEHACPRPCHEGLCGSCDVRVPARCYCGQVEKHVLCDDRGEDKESHRTHVGDDGEHTTEDWIGSFDCGNLCGRAFDCGVHFCEQGCHTQSQQPGNCPQAADVVTHCPCGKTSLADLTEMTRQSCTDPIPQCKQRCGKSLPCGHEDEHICHSGNCMPCSKMVDIKCRCRRTTSRTICHQGKEEPPQCARMCKVLLSCGRHNCDERCCPGERKATERQSTKKKQRPLGFVARPLEDAFEAEHICTLQCGRLLKCGTHVCEELCHRGACGTCREAVFNEVSCRCGKTVLQPPLPCGTKPPHCRFPCDRPKTCGHPKVQHNCHQDDEACPKCPYLMEKRCLCGKKNVKNQQCWLQDVRCGEICGKKLRCGSHLCRKPCHRPGECEDANGEPCQQPCGKLKKICEHPDLEHTCHAPYACKEDKPCQSKIYIMCDCQAQKQEMRCGASKSSEGNAEKILACNEECARLERNRKLAVALNIDQSAHVDGGDHIPYSADTLDLFAEHSNWGQTQEREFRVFASSPDEKRLRFKPMQPHQRAFLHALAEDFGLDSESMDPEPNRHVMIWKTPRFVSAPNKTLADALRIRRSQRSAMASANVSDSEGVAKKSKSSLVPNEPYNAFVISNPRFGLTVDELRAEIDNVTGSSTILTFDIHFLPSEHVLLQAVSKLLSRDEVQVAIQNLKTTLIAGIAGKGYGTPELCASDASLNVTRRESDHVAGDGWSRVAAKKSAPRSTVSGVAKTESNTFAALGSSKITFSKKKVDTPKPKKEMVVDDWETAELAAEEKEASPSNVTGDGFSLSPAHDGDLEIVKEGTVQVVLWK